MKTITDRIIERMYELKLRQMDITHATGASKATVNNWINNHRSPSVQYLEDLAKVLNVSIQWLVTGVEVEVGKQNFTKDVVKKAPILKLTEVYDYKNHIITVDDPNRKYQIFVDKNYGATFWVVLTGDSSMVPDFNDGDLILIDTKRQPRTGNFVIITIDGDIKSTIRKFRICYDNKADKEYFEFVALNDFYPIIDSRRQRITIYGVVVQIERFFV